MENSGMIASRDIKTEPGIVVPIVEPVIKQEYIEPNPIVNETQSSGIPELHGNIVKNEIIETRRQEERIAQEMPTAWTRAIPGRLTQFKKAKKKRPKATSDTVKSLVEGEKYRYNHLQLSMSRQNKCWDSLQVTAQKTYGGQLIQSVDVKSVNNHEETVNFFLKIQKTCEIDTFELSELKSSAKRLKISPEIMKCGSFRFKTVKSSQGASANTYKFLENCEGVENILLTTSCCNVPQMMRLVSLPAVINCKVLQVTNRCADFLWSVAKKCIDNNEIVPNRTTGFPSSRHAIPFIASQFGDRVIHEKVNEVRIRTDDESKHFLIRRNKDSSFGSLFSFTVIPSNLLEWECERSTWFQELTALGSAYEDFSDSE